MDTRHRGGTADHGGGGGGTPALVRLGEVPRLVPRGGPGPERHRGQRWRHVREDMPLGAQGLRLLEGLSSAGRVAPACPFQPQRESPDTLHGSSLRQRPCTLTSRFQSPEHVGTPAAAGACGASVLLGPLSPLDQLARQRQRLLAKFTEVPYHLLKAQPFLLDTWTRSHGRR